VLALLLIRMSEGSDSPTCLVITPVVLA